MKSKMNTGLFFHWSRFVFQVFTQDGTYVRQFGRNQLSSPSYLAVSEDNRVIVSDTNNHRVKVYSAEGRTVSTFGSAGGGERTPSHSSM